VTPSTSKVSVGLLLGLLLLYRAILANARVAACNSFLLNAVKMLVASAWDCFFLSSSLAFLVNTDSSASAAACATVSLFPLYFNPLSPITKEKITHNNKISTKLLNIFLNMNY